MDNVDGEKKLDGRQGGGQQEGGALLPGQRDQAAGDEEDGPVLRGAEIEGLATAPDDHEHYGEQAVGHGAECPGHRERAEGPEEEAVGVMLVDVVDLGDEPDAGAVEHGAERGEGLAELRLPAFLGQQAGGGEVGADDCREDQGQFAGLGDLVPVVGEEQDDAEADDDGACGGEDEEAPRHGLGGRVRRLLVALADPVALFRRHEALRLPAVDLSQKPADIFVHVANARRGGTQAGCGERGNEIEVGRIILNTPR